MNHPFLPSAFCLPPFPFTLPDGSGGLLNHSGSFPNGRGALPDRPVSFLDVPGTFLNHLGSFPDGHRGCPEACGRLPDGRGSFPGTRFKARLGAKNRRVIVPIVAGIPRVIIFWLSLLVFMSLTELKIFGFFQKRFRP
jgi:hypothetical protein